MPCVARKENMRTTHPLLRQLPRALILAVPEQFDNTTFVGCKSAYQRKKKSTTPPTVICMLFPYFSTSSLPAYEIPPQSLPPQSPPSTPYVPRNLLDDLPHKSRALAQMAFSSRDAGLDFAEVGFLATSAFYQHRSYLVIRG